MFDKKIILLISFLLVTGSSYFIFHRKKDNNDEVNIEDNSDNSINDDANEEESINDTESSSSFLKYFFLFVIIVIVAIIMFFAVKKIIKKKKTSNEEKPKELKENIENKINPNNTNPKNNTDNKNNTEENKEYKYSEEFKRYCEYKNEPKELKVTTPEEITDLTNRIIDQMKQDYDDYIKDKKLNPEKYDKDNYLIDFYFKPDSKDEYDMEIDIKDDETKDLILKNNNKRVREISIEKNEEIIHNLFTALFEELKSCKALAAKIGEYFPGGKDEECEEKINSFFFNIIDPFLECVSRRKNEDIRFISKPNKIHDDFKKIFNHIIHGENNYLDNGDEKEQSDVNNIDSFIYDISYDENRLAFFAKVFNDLINFHFSESRYLNKIKYKI